MGEIASFRLPNDIMEELKSLSKKEGKDKSVLVREMLLSGISEKKIGHAIKEYKEGRITLWKAARMANVSLYQMIGILKNKHIEIQYSNDDLLEDLKALEE
jgi:predicted HTH domain antitoxin